MLYLFLTQNHYLEQRPMKYTKLLKVVDSWVIYFHFLYFLFVFSTFPLVHIHNNLIMQKYLFLKFIRNNISFEIGQF